MKPREYKPIAANVSPEVRAFVEKVRARRAAEDRKIAAASEKVREAEKAAGIGTLGDQVFTALFTRNREEVRAVDEFADEVRSEDQLLKEQEAQWEQEDEKAGLK